MDRRYFLGIAGSVLVAGCASEGNSENGKTTSTPAENRGNENPTQAPSPTETQEEDTTTPTRTEYQEDRKTTSTPTQDQEATIEVVNSSFILGDSVTAPPGGQIPWARTEVENTSLVDHGRIRTELRFYDTEDTLIEAREGYTGYIPANTVWRDYIRYYTETPEELDHVETRIVENDPVVNGTEIREATVISSEMTADPEGGVDLAAEVDLGGANPDRVTVVGLFYDAQGMFRGALRDVDTNPTDTVAVSTASITIRTPPNLEGQQVESHELVVLDGYI